MQAQLHYTHSSSEGLFKGAAATAALLPIKYNALDISYIVAGLS